MLTWIIVTPLVFTLFLYFYAVGLTHRKAYVRRLAMADLNAFAILEVMARPEHRKLALKDWGYRRRYALGNLPLLHEDLRACLQGTGSLRTIGIGLWFYAFLGLVWLKAFLLPGADDIRALIGVESLLVSGARA